MLFRYLRHRKPCGAGKNTRISRHARDYLEWGNPYLLQNYEDLALHSSGINRQLLRLREKYDGSSISNSKMVKHTQNRSHTIITMSKNTNAAVYIYEKWGTLYFTELFLPMWRFKLQSPTFFKIKS